MSKTINGMLFTLLALTLVLGACSPATATPTAAPIVSTATSAPTESPTAAPTATLVPVPLAGPQPASTMKWIDTSLLAFIPAGEFSMGIGAGDAPVHSVALDAFWIQQTKVTNGMYAQCVAAGGCTPPTQELGAPVFTNTDYSSHPVVGVTWDQAGAYCAWTGGRLPTEAEWEKAARGTGGNTFPWGADGAACDLMNYAGCIRHTSSVTDYQLGRSPFGLYDMAGNVFEWVEDWYSETWYNEAPAMNPAGPTSGEFRVIRGSSFESEPADGIESGVRHFMAPAITRRDVGFRCVVPEPQPLAPFCQVTAYVPGAGGLPADQCQLPVVDVRGNYCASGDGFVTMNISEGASFTVNRQDYECEEAVVDGKRLVTCKGPRSTETSAEVTVCNEACSGAPGQSGAAAVCDPGYTLDATSGMCVYSPIPSVAGQTGCPAGYKVIDRGGQSTCALVPGADGQCPTGLYLDSLYGACISPSGLAEIPYGISNPELAQGAFAGCAAGYEYEPSFQCCQAATNTTYPACAPGTTYNSDSKACVPTEIRVSAPGCVTVEATTLKCSDPVDICSKITQETVCLRNSYACTWDEQNDVCKLKK